LVSYVFCLAAPPIFRVLSSKTLKIEQNLGEVLLLVYLRRTPQKVETRSPNLITLSFFFIWGSLDVDVDVDPPFHEGERKLLFL
jgi:hypothetical protein